MIYNNFLFYTIVRILPMKEASNHYKSLLQTNHQFNIKE